MCHVQTTVEVQYPQIKISHSLWRWKEISRQRGLKNTNVNNSQQGEKLQIKPVK